MTKMFKSKVAAAEPTNVNKKRSIMDMPMFSMAAAAGKKES